MSKNIVLFSILAIGFSSLAMADAKIDPRLKSFAHGQGAHATARVIAILENKLDGEAAPHKYKRDAVISYLRAHGYLG